MELVDYNNSNVLTSRILFDGATSSNFTLSDDYTNYEYIEVIYRPHPAIGQKSDKMIPSKSTMMHCTGIQTISGVTTIYRCQLTFNGKNVTLNGRTQVLGGTALDAVETTIYRVIGYK